MHHRFMLYSSRPAIKFTAIFTVLILFLSSVLNRTPVHLIHEIILVDDFSEDRKYAGCISYSIFELIENNKIEGDLQRLHTLPVWYIEN